MKTQKKKLKRGDWIVHQHYGLGQISKVETKTIAGELRQYYRVEIDDGSFWVPVEETINERVRPIASPERFKRAIEALKEAPGSMELNFKSRKKRIAEDLGDGDLVTDIRLMRDMSARHRLKKLSTTEKTTLENIKSRIVQEWSIIAGKDLTELTRKLDRMLKNSADLVEQT